MQLQKSFRKLVISCARLTSFNMQFLKKFLLVLTLVSHSSCQGLDNVNLKLAASHTPPFEILSRWPNGSYTLAGPTVMAFKWLEKKLNFTFTVVPVEEARLAKLGTEAVFEKVINMEVDGILSGFVITPSRKKVMDFTYPIWIEPYTLLTPTPDEESRLFAFIRPFQPTVWLCFCLTLLIVVILMTSFSRVYINSTINTKRVKRNRSSRNEDNGNAESKTEVLKRVKRNRSSRNEDNGNAESKTEVLNRTIFYFVYVINIVTNHGTYLPYSQLSFRMLTGCWLLALIVLINSYSSIVVSSLTIPIMKPSINSLENLAESNDVHILIRGDHALGQQILNATSGIFKVLGDQAHQQPADRIQYTATSLTERLETGRYAYPYTILKFMTANRYFVANHFKKKSTCRFQSSFILEIPSAFLCIFLQKNSRYTAAINLGALRLWETGLNKHWVDEMIPIGADRCLQNQKTSLREVKIKMYDLVSAFFILGIGMGLALLSLTFEITIRTCT